MSHFTTIQTQVRDVSALREACDEPGLEIITKTKARGYGRNRLDADLVIRLSGPYDIAVNQQPITRLASRPTGGADIASCQEEDWTADECVAWMAAKYELDKTHKE